MQVSYQYATPSVIVQQEDHITLGLSPDLLRDEKVSFVGRVKHPLIFRDAMLMLREIVISDLRMKKKDYSDFFAWLNQELDLRMLHKDSLVKVRRKELQDQIDTLLPKLNNINRNISSLNSSILSIQETIRSLEPWYEYQKLEPQFRRFLQSRDPALYRALDPVITVHPDQVSFEAFSLDETTYGCLSIKMEEFDLVRTPKLGTTNIDFSKKLAQEMERFRTYNEAELSINPEGFIVDTGVVPEHLEKKIELPESWIKGFTQVSSAAALGGLEIEILPIDIYDICSFLRRNKAHTSPRSMKWVFEPNKRIRVIFEPWDKELELSTVYSGKRKHVERIWGRRRWLIMEKVIPISKSFKLKLLGFGMPQFIIADLGFMSITIGLTSWSSNDWVKGTSFNILAGFIGKENERIYDLLKKNRIMTMEEIKDNLRDIPEEEIKSGIGTILRRGDGYYDPIVNAYRFRQLLNIPLPRKIYEVTSLEREVLQELNNPKDNFSLYLTKNFELVIENQYSQRIRRRYSDQTVRIKTELKFDQDKKITKVNCKCKEFKKGPRNISAPCKHILTNYIISSKFLNLLLIPEKKYKINELESMIQDE